MARSKKRRRAVCLVSLGCAKNTVDSERMLASLVEAGFLVAGDPADADAVVVNTCGFIAPAREESTEILREFALLRREGEIEALVAVGCMVTRLGPEVASEGPGIDVALGLDRLGELPAVLGGLLGRRVGATAREADFDSGARLPTGPPGSAYLKIAEGCDNRCAYCTIPDIRGPLRSRPPEDLIAEAEGLVACGALELNLIAQDVAAYGADLGRPGLLVELLEGLSAIGPLRWIRLLYAHPAHVDEGLIGAVAAGGKICPYMDLPIQHIDDIILMRMGRGGDRAGERIRRLVRGLRERIPEMAIRTTVMVGFPGETGEAHRALVDYIREGHFAHLGVFSYSLEEGTPAAGLEGRVEAEVARRRAEEVIEAQASVCFGRLDGLVGRELDVLVELPAGDGAFGARTVWDAPEVDSGVVLRGQDLRPGTIRRALVEGRRGYDLLASARGGDRG